VTPRKAAKERQPTRGPRERAQWNGDGGQKRRGHPPKGTKFRLHSGPDRSLEPKWQRTQRRNLRTHQPNFAPDSHRDANNDDRRDGFEPQFSFYAEVTELQYGRPKMRFADLRKMRCRNLCTHHPNFAPGSHRDADNDDRRDGSEPHFSLYAEVTELQYGRPKMRFAE